MHKKLLYRQRLSIREVIFPDDCLVEIENGNQFCVYQVRQEPWTGEGLPPVGTVCLMLQHKCAPVEVQIRYQEANICVWVETSIAREFCTADAHKLEFRPIRTPEQIAAESRESTIKQFMQIGDIYYCDAEKLYDAGARIVTEDKP